MLMRKLLFILLLLFPFFSLIGNPADHKSGVTLHPFPSDFSCKPDSAYELPDYVKKRRVKEKEIYIKTDVFLIPGSLTYPRCKKNIPLVILVHGAGPQDRDATVGPNKIFKDLAWGLASKGIAVLRYDKRTLIYQERMKERYGNKITVMEETVSDVISAINLAKTLPRIDPQKIFVAGHSLGGMVAPRIASMKPGLAGIIVMAGNARPLEDIILEQVKYVSALKVPQVTYTGSQNIPIDRLEQQVAVVKSPHLSEEIPTAELPMNLSASYWIDIKNYNHIAAAKNAKVPMLFLQGQRDYQVTLADFTIWKKELNNLDKISFKLYADLNHLFLEGTGISYPDEYNIKGNIPDYVILDIVNWVKKDYW